MSTLDSNLLQQLIDDTKKEHKDALVIGINPNTGDNVWEVSETILLPSDFTLYLKDCTLRLADDCFCNMFANASAFSEEPERQHNIRIIGQGEAVLDGGNHNGLTEKTSGKDGRPTVHSNLTIFFRNVSGFAISDLKIMRPRWWAMAFCFSDNGTISDITFDADNSVPNQDGIDLRVGCHHITIENIYGRTGDDTVALTALEDFFLRNRNVKGSDIDLHDITIRNIHTWVSGGHHQIRLLNHDGIRLYNIDIDHVYDETIGTGRLRARASVKVGDTNYSHSRRAYYGETYNIRINHVVSNARSAVLIGSPCVSNLSIENVTNVSGEAVGVL